MAAMAHFGAVVGLCAFFEFLVCPGANLLPM